MDKDYRGGGPLNDVESKHAGETYPRDVNFAALSGDPNSLINSQDQLQRGLKSRHIQFLALGGAIGTGLFVGSGSILSTVGPAPLFMGYLSMMMVVWNIMNNLGEMATYLPLKGISIPYFVERFVEPSLAFAAGWNYWYAYAMLVGAEASAGAILLDYWQTPVPPAVWITIILLVTLALNIFAIEIFGEAEFWFASIKLITILGLIMVSLVIILGGAPDEGRIGFLYWYDPGAIIPYMAEGNTGRFLAYWTGFVRAGFAFITSPELIALAAGETIAPRRNIPKAARRFVWRLAIFYGIGSLMIGAITPSNDPRLLNPNSNAASSPWVIGIQRAGIGGLNHVINAAILTSAWSAGNAFLYSGSRILYSLALNKQAPRFFARTTKRGVPYTAVLGTWSIALLSYLTISSGTSTVFTWFMNISTISGFIAWIVVMITYLRFRKAMIYHNMMHRLPFRTPLQPYFTWFILGLLVILTLTNGFQVFFPGEWSTSDFLAAYITLPIFFVLYVGHKIWFRTPFARRVADVDVTTGVAEMEAMAELDEEPIPKNMLQKVWFWIA
ncbi:Putative amino acid permease/ SLC12A domain-containing protein [Colletotrichum destructivum]|uniref:Amino acid permease/ SLC12A domain-containing protein n=1 Tax=Colletotrichum destructivum TaxID=34406 RepID=A0AAX4IC60_9PEZI|nr:Putative amino acid permease/ SLC12A domain-containing protein [Colletotrichum destructivum]